MQSTVQSSNRIDRRLQAQLIHNRVEPKVATARSHSPVATGANSDKKNEPAELCAGSNKTVTNHQSLRIARRAIHELISTGGITK